MSYKEIPYFRQMDHRSENSGWAAVITTCVTNEEQWTAPVTPGPFTLF
jgi:hypothetical protein